jgi:chromosome segregation ATPase
MDEAQFLGYLVMAIITLGGFVAVIMKITQPINDLRVVVQELRDCINTLKTDNATQNRRLDEHGRDIDALKLDVETLKTRMNMYHD